MTYRPNCGPTAMAAILDIDVDHFMDEHRRIHTLGPRWQGGARLEDLIKTAKRLGHTFKAERAGGLLRTWAVRETIPGRRYIVRTGGHFMALVDGKVIDQVGNDRMARLGKNRVTHAYFLKVAA